MTKAQLLVQEKIRECRETQNPFLDLGNLSLREIPAEVFTLTHLRRLNLGRRFYTEDGVWKKNENLKSQYFEDNTIRILPASLFELEDLEELGLEGNPVHDLQGLQHFSKLKVLNLCDTKSKTYSSVLAITSLEVLHLGENRIIHLELFQSAQCKGLKVLDLSDNFISEISDLENFLALEILSINSNYLTHMRGVGMLIGLKELYLEMNAIEKIEALKYLTNLEKLSLGYAKVGYERKYRRYEKKQSNNLKCIEGLETLSRLKGLDLSGNQIHKIEGLDNILELESLWLGHNAIERIENLAHLEKLKILGLGLKYPDFHIDDLLTYREVKSKNGNLIKRIENLGTLINLDQLYLDRNKIEEIEHLDALKNLTLLNLRDNQISEIKNLKFLSNLNSLILCNNRITEIKNLEQLLNLKCLDLDANQITELSNLESLINLSELYLRNNQIKDIRNLEKLVNITSLCLDGNQIVEIKNLDNLVNLSDLDLSTNQIVEIKNLDNLVNLSDLNLSTNQIVEIKNLDNLVNLSDLNLSTNQIVEIKNLDSLVNLSDLNLSTNQIAEIKNLDSITNLIILDLRSNQIGEIKNLNTLRNLTFLILWENQILELKNLNDLVNLIYLDLDSNQISELKNLEGLINLTSLDLRNNQITELKNLDNLVNLTFLGLSSNQITELKNLDSLVNLTFLYMWENQITGLNNLDSLVNLTSLDLSNNKISELKNLNALVNLTSLRLYDNQITELKNLDTLTNLIHIDLDGNKIDKVKNIENAIHLESINLGRNFLKLYPDFTNFIILKALNLSYNQLIEFKPNLLNNPYLSNLSLKGQIFTNIPNEITEQENCLEDARNWFKGLEKDSVTTHEAKLILMGNGRVGKTCILKRLFFNTYTEGESSTHGIQLYSKDFEVDFTDQPLRINAWDFGGQEIYHATHRLFMQSRALFITVWDAKTEQQPLAPEHHGEHELIFKNHELSYWLDHARALSRQSPLLVVQTKVDLHNPQLPEKSNSLQERFEINDFHGVSAATKAGFGVLKAKIFEEFEKMPEVGMRTPGQWIKVKEKLLEEKQSKQLIAYPDYIELCKNEGLSESEADTLIRFLHNTGTLFYHAHLFNNLIILDQEWALKGIYAVVQRGGDFYEMLKISKGLTSLKVLGLVWRDYPVDTQKVFLSMMENCEICFQTTENKTNPGYLIPEFLFDAKHESIQAFWENIGPEELCIRYQHDFFHQAFITRFICRAGRLAKSYDHIWKNGIWITHGRTHALIEAFPAIHQVHIRVKGQYAAELLYRIHKEFKEIFYKPEKVSIEVRLGEGEFESYTPPKRTKIREKEAEEQKKSFPSRIEDVDLFCEALDPESENQIERRLKEIVPAPKSKPSNDRGLGLTIERIQKLKLQLKTLMGADLEKTMERFDALLKDCQLKNDLIVKRGEYKLLQRFINKGTLDYEKSVTQTNQIRSSVLALIDQIEMEDLMEDEVLRFLLDG